MKKRKNRPSNLTYNVVKKNKERPFGLSYKIEYIKCFRCEKMKNKNTTLLLKWGRSFFVICKSCNNKYRLMPNRIK